MLAGLLEDGAPHFRLITVHAPDPLAARFYERCGFTPWQAAPPITHRRSPSEAA